MKKNQPTLYRQLEQITGRAEKISSAYTAMETNRGRSERRRVVVSDCTEGIDKEWVGLKEVVSVQRFTKEKGKIKEETAYFISSRKANALFYAEGIRLHWQIENSLHWVKDVTFGEDASKIRTGHAPQNLSTIKNIAMNIFRKNDYSNMAQAMRVVANKIELIKNLIT